jgi:hypothetical protein
LVEVLFNVMRDVLGDDDDVCLITCIMAIVIANIWWSDVMSVLNALGVEPFFPPQPRTRRAGGGAIVSRLIRLGKLYSLLVLSVRRIDIS